MAGRSRGTLLLVVAGLLTAAACTKWVVHPVPPPPAPMQTISGMTRVTLSDKQVLELTNVVIATDSLFGLSAYIDRTRHSMLLKDVVKIEEQRKNPKQTLITMGVIVFALFAFTDVFGGPFLR
jgi:hypothetical protein